MKSLRISIIGCGWLGLPLGEYLVEKGMLVKGSTTTPAKLKVLSDAGIEPFLINFSPQAHGDQLDTLLDADVIIIALPPSKVEHTAGAYAQTMAQLSQLVQDAKIVFISSTSVYPDLNRWVVESDADASAEGINLKLLKAEQVWQKEHGKNCTVLRLGGLMGYNRMPGKYFAGKQALGGANVPVNLIHRDDAVAIIYQLIVQQRWGQIYNAVADKHPSRKELFLLNAQMAGFTPPEFILSAKEYAYKLISNSKLKEELSYQFKYVDPLDFTYTD